MAKPIFVNAAVSDLARATAFYEAIGANVPVEANNWLAHMHGTVVHSKLSFGPFELTIGTTALMAPSPAQAWRGGWGGGLAGGLIAGALIGGIASSAYAYGPGTVSLARRNVPHLYRTWGRSSILGIQAFGSRSNIDDKDTFKIPQMPNNRAALTRLWPVSYF
jgi:hypothetical protein